MYKPRSISASSAKVRIHPTFTRSLERRSPSLTLSLRKFVLFPSPGVLELTHNHGTESDASFAGYASGNDEPGKGYGHIAITVDDVQAACARFEALGVPFKKRLTDGVMKNIAFIKDPDG